MKRTGFLKDGFSKTNSKTLIICELISECFQNIIKRTDFLEDGFSKKNSKTLSTICELISSTPKAQKP